MSKLSVPEAKSLAQGHAASEWENQDSNPGHLATETEYDYTKGGTRGAVLGEINTLSNS